MMTTNHRWVTDTRKAGNKITHFEVWYYDPYREQFFNSGWMTIAKAEKLEREGKKFFKGKVVVKVVKKLRKGVMREVEETELVEGQATRIGPPSSASKAATKSTLRKRPP